MHTKLTHTLAALTLWLAAIPALGQLDTNCAHIGSKPEWNYSLCMDKSMGVDDTQMGKYVVTKYSSLGEQSGSMSTSLSITCAYNSAQQTVQELWQSKFGNRQFDGWELTKQSDTLIVHSNARFYVVTTEIRNPATKERMSLSNAIGLYKTQYYTFSAIGINNISTRNFMLDVINRSSFEGEPAMQDDSKQLANFVEAIRAGLSDRKKLDKVLITADIFYDALPEEGKKEMGANREGLNAWMESWNSTVNALADEVKRCGSIQLELVDVRREEAEESAGFGSYLALVQVNCDGTSKAYRMIWMQLNGTMYLGKVVAQ